MKKIWHDEAWADYLYWQTQDKKMYVYNGLGFDQTRGSSPGLNRKKLPADYEFLHQAGLFRIAK